jgi:hypothetical protein
MIGAIAKVHWPNGFFLNWELTAGKGHGYAVRVLPLDDSQNNTPEIVRLFYIQIVALE